MVPLKGSCIDVVGAAVVDGPETEGASAVEGSSRSKERRSTSELAGFATSAAAAAIVAAAEGVGVARVDAVTPLLVEVLFVVVVAVEDDDFDLSLKVDFDEALAAEDEEEALEEAARGFDEEEESTRISSNPKEEIFG